MASISFGNISVGNTSSSGSGSSIKESSPPILSSTSETLLEGDTIDVGISMKSYTGDVVFVTDSEYAVINGATITLHAPYIDIPEKVIPINVYAIETGGGNSSPTTLQLTVLNLLVDSTSVNGASSANNYVGTQLFTNNTFNTSNLTTLTDFVIV